MREALRFIHIVRDDEGLRREISGLGFGPPLEQIAAIGARLGCDFTPADLEQAFRHDAALRWIFYTTRAARAVPGSDEES